MKDLEELLRGLEIAKLEPKRSLTLKSDITGMLDGLASAVLDGERSLAVAKEDLREKAFNYLVSFLMSFASRTGTRDRLQIFTTNYDRFIEAGAEVAGLHLLDRFVGSLAPYFARQGSTSTFITTRQGFAASHAILKE